MSSDTPRDVPDADGSLPPDIEEFRETYREMFGEVPPLPGRRFPAAADLDVEFLRRAEELRAHAFHNDVLDERTTQLVVFGMLTMLSVPPAKWHALAARRAGASWEELSTVVQLATTVVALWPFNNGYGLLGELRAAERGEQAG